MTQNLLGAGVFLIQTVAGLYLILLLLRFLMQLSRVDYYNPICQAIVKVTDPPVKPLKKILPTIRGVDVSTPPGKALKENTPNHPWSRRFNTVCHTGCAAAGDITCHVPQRWICLPSGVYRLVTGRTAFNNFQNLLLLTYHYGDRKLGCTLLKPPGDGAG